MIDEVTEVVFVTLHLLQGLRPIVFIPASLVFGCYFAFKLKKS